MVMPWRLDYAAPTPLRSDIGSGGAASAAAVVPSGERVMSGVISITGIVVRTADTVVISSVEVR
jgi:hypothetical protein